MRHIRTILFWVSLAMTMTAYAGNVAKAQKGQKTDGEFALANANGTATICYDATDAKVVGITAQMLADDVERITGQKARVVEAATVAECPSSPVVIAGTIGHSRIIDKLIADGAIDVSEIRGRWEAHVITTLTLPKHRQALVIAGSDRRGTAYGLTSLSRAIGVSPWYWWADVTPAHRESISLSASMFAPSETKGKGWRHIEKGPSVQYRGIFINDERFGGWARWVENTFDTETHRVGPKVYKRVFELLLRLKANYLWPAMHPGTQAFNADPENARLADDYAIVMGSSHCEQMLRNNEGEWKAVGTYGDFNYITNRKVMQDYWEERVKTNGRYENTYTLGLRGIHDYPMEGANTVEQRVALMQQALNDQRDMLRRNIDRPVEEVPQILCTYEEVLDAYHSGLVVPDDVTLLWSDDKQGYTRNLCNPEEMKRPGGAGIYYHLSYHGDPASWIWLSPLSPSFISTELTKAYTYGAQKVWVMNVGDIKPAEKEITFAMDMAWDVNRWAPQQAGEYIRLWADETFGSEYADEIATMQQEYYSLMASGKDSHVFFVEYPESEIKQRIVRYRDIAQRAEALAERIPERLKAAYFELVLYPIRGAQLLNEYQLMARLSLVHATEGKTDEALMEGAAVPELHDALNRWTSEYNDSLMGGKWRGFFDWHPYHWNGSTKIDVEYFTPQSQTVLATTMAPKVSQESSLPSLGGVGGGFTFSSPSAGEAKLWVKAKTPVRNFSKAREDNIFARVTCGNDTFLASAMPINNVWHSPLVGPRWCEVGTLNVNEGINVLQMTDIAPEASIEDVFVGLYPPLPAEPLMRVPATDFTFTHDVIGKVTKVEQLGFAGGVTVLPFDTPSYDVADAPYAEYTIDCPATATALEVRTLPTLHIYEGRDARFAVQIDERPTETFTIHEGDFTSEWRLNVLRGYATRTVALPAAGRHTIRIYFLDPGIVLQELIVK